MAEMDRGTSSSAGVRNISSVKKSAVILIIAALIAALLILQPYQSPETPSQKLTAGIEYTFHSPIRINNNSMFAAKAIIL